MLGMRDDGGLTRYLHPCGCATTRGGSVLAMCEVHGRLDHDAPKCAAIGCDQKCMPGVKPLTYRTYCLGHMVEAVF